MKRTPPNQPNPHHGASLTSALLVIAAPAEIGLPIEPRRAHVLEHDSEKTRTSDPGISTLSMNLVTS